MRRVIILALYLEALKSYDNSLKELAYVYKHPLLPSLIVMLLEKNCGYRCSSLSGCVAPSFSRQNHCLFPSSSLLNFNFIPSTTRIRFASSHSKVPQLHLSWFSDVSTFPLVGVPSTPHLGYIFPVCSGGTFLCCVGYKHHEKRRGKS